MNRNTKLHLCSYNKTTAVHTAKLHPSQQLLHQHSRRVEKLTGDLLEKKPLTNVKLKQREGDQLCHHQGSTMGLQNSSHLFSVKLM